jgi:hypothetical protein
MVSIKIPQDTTFSFDVPGRYACNTLDEALDSTNPNLPDQADARPFDYVVIGGGSFGAALTARLFNLDVTHSHRILVIEAGPLALQEHVQNLPPDFSPPGKGAPGTVWGQPWVSDSPMSFNQGFPGLAFCVGGRSVFWGGWSPYLIDSEVADPSWPTGVKKDLMTPVLPPSNPKESYLDTAARQIGTDTTNDFVFGPLHNAMRDRLFKGLKARGAGDVLAGNRGVLNAKEELEAPLAVSSSSPRPGMFSLNKFSGVQLLFRALRVAQGEAEAAARPGTPEVQNTKKRLMLVDNCYVTKIERAGQNGEPKEQDYTAGPILQPGKWYEYEIEVVGDKYTVRLGEAKDGQPTAFQQITTFTKPAGKYQSRGLAPAPDNSSGYIGVQAHTEKVAFRHIRIQKK